MTNRHISLLTYVVVGAIVLFFGMTAHAYPPGTRQTEQNSVCTGTETTGSGGDIEPAQGTPDTGALDVDVVEPFPPSQYLPSPAAPDFYANPQNYCVQGVETSAYPYNNGSYEYDWNVYTTNGYRAQNNNDFMPGGIAYNQGHFSYLSLGIYIPTAPTASLTANAPSIVSGSTSVLTSQCTNSTSASIDNGVGTVSSTNDSKSVSPTSSTTYTLTCTGVGGTATASAPVTVTQPAAPTAQLTASSNNISQGSSITLNYACTNSTSASISPTVGTVTPVSGGTTAPISPGSTTTYTLTCTGNGTATASQAITVGSAPATPTGLTYSCNASGTAVNFSWTPVSGATVYYPRILQPTAAQCTSFGWQVYNVDGTCYPNPDTDTATSFTNFPVTPGQTYDMWTQAANQYGSSAVVHINPSIICYAPPTVSCSVSPSSISTGGSATWTATPSGGNGTYTYAWSIPNGTPGSGTTQSVTSMYNVAGTFGAAVGVTSNGVSTGAVNCSNSVTVSAAAQPDLYELTAPTPSTATVNVPQTFTGTNVIQNIGAATASNFPNVLEVVSPSNAISYVQASPATMTLAPNGTGSVSASYTFPTTGTYKVRWCANTNYLDGSQVIAESNFSNNCGNYDPVNVTSGVGTLTASCGVSPSSATTGQNVTWSSAVSGGTTPYTYTWGGSVSGSAASEVESYLSPGTYSGQVTVHSSDGQQVLAICSAGGGGSGGNGPTVTVTSCTPTLSAYPSTINQGQQSTLTWSEPAACDVQNSCTFSDGHVAGLSGNNYVVTPPTPSSGNIDTYAVTCPASIPSQTAQTNITVNSEGYTITANPNRVPVNSQTLVTWNSTNATTCNITRNGSSWKTGLNGSVQDTITTQTVYSMICDGLAPVKAVVNVLPAFQEF